MAPQKNKATPRMAKKDEALTAEVTINAMLRLNMENIAAWFRKDLFCMV